MFLTRVTAANSFLSNVTVASDLICYIWGNKMEEFNISSLKLALYSLPWLILELWQAQGAQANSLHLQRNLLPRVQSSGLREFVTNLLCVFMSWWGTAVWPYLQKNHPVCLLKLNKICIFIPILIFSRHLVNFTLYLARQLTAQRDYKAHTAQWS